MNKEFWSTDIFSEPHGTAVKALRTNLSKLQTLLSIEIDIDKEIEKLLAAPRFIPICNDVISKCLSRYPQYQQDKGDKSKTFTFTVEATHNKYYYCAAKLADAAIRVQGDGFPYLVTFRGDQIQEISLMFSSLMDSFDPRKKPEWFDPIYEYLYQHDFSQYLSRSIREYLSDLQDLEGYSSFLNNSVLITISKQLNRKISEQLNKLYMVMLQEKRATVKWSSEYSLYALIKQYIAEAVYQYRVDWLGQQSFDIFLPSQNIAIEYQGKQHYEAVELFGGDAALDDNKERDIRKRKLAAEHGVQVLDWRYDIPVNRANVLTFFDQHGILYGDPVIDYSVETVEYTNPMAPVKQKAEKAKVPKAPCASEFVIRQYSVNGQFIEEYSSFAEAAQKSEVSERAIKKVVYGERKTGGGYIWQRCHRDSEITNTAPVEYAENTGVAKKVLQLNEDGSLIAEYESIGQAVKQTGVSSRGISDVLAGVQKTAGGYIWLYKKDKLS